MRRRAFLTLLGGAPLAMSAAAHAQQAGVRRLGYLGTGGPSPVLLDAFREGLRERGWVEGRNLLIEYRFAEGRMDRLPGLAEELVRLNVEVIAASPTPAALAAKNATATIPIVGIS